LFLILKIGKKIDDDNENKRMFSGLNLDAHLEPDENDFIMLDGSGDVTKKTLTNPAWSDSEKKKEMDEIVKGLETGKYKLGKRLNKRSINGKDYMLNDQIEYLLDDIYVVAYIQFHDKNTHATKQIALPYPGKFQFVMNWILNMYYACNNNKLTDPRFFEFKIEKSRGWIDNFVGHPMFPDKVTYDYSVYSGVKSAFTGDNEPPKNEE
jgi:hypothetical protein